ncbi:MAG TPA: hypothetical protein EYN46_06095 [Candidatus Poseidoniales archaeon]|jgi:hypothetical protein|nr:MAG: hypothetical protein CXX80_11895 [Euryarchaeota archaeon]HIA40421.1 hypothetical protein [Candidatus Poseidoniales archaeon]PXY74409.1 MAG: hypothetical protein CXX80_07135 [Euryarchaeota archaeon]PXY76825.1 MAG: hypothetical protein CXX80_02440 [Euryarchaeota archaeon]HIB59542.1 hypothetical protein [Candidatus Poseidoniales archaeon]
MPACRLCGGIYPRENFIHGIGPRKDVCVRCGVEHKFVEAEEVPILYDPSTATARMTLLARRYSPFLWVILLWSAWVTVLSGIAVWGLASAVLLGLATLALIPWFVLSSAAYQAKLARLSADYARPPGH